MDLSGSENGMSEATTIEAATIDSASGASAAVSAGALDTKSIRPQPYPVEVDHGRDKLLTDFGRETLDDRYLLPGEGYQDLFVRVASAYADDAAHAQRLYDYISKLWFMPATPVLSNGGTGRGLPISCFLNSVPDSLNGIVETWNENVWLASRGGGIGTYWGNVRGIGEPVGLNGKTSGIIPFVRVMDSLTLAISQGSLRRGSAACYLDINHPEIEEFLEIRKPSGDFNRKALNLHHGVLITDAFMEAVRTGSSFDLVSPKDGSKRAEVDARSLFQKIVETRLATGEPYIVFIDKVNSSMPAFQRDVGLKVTTSNLCSEITLPTGKDQYGELRTAVCCLSSLNLETWDEWNGDKRFIEDVMRFLDNVLQDYIDRAEPGMGAGEIFGDARAFGRSGRDGLPFLPAGAQAPVRRGDGEELEPQDLPPPQAGRGRRLNDARHRAWAVPGCGRSRRDGAVQLQDRDRADRVDQHHLRRYLGVHRADPGEHLYAQDAVRQLLDSQSVSREIAHREVEEFGRGVELDP